MAALGLTAAPLGHPAAHCWCGDQEQRWDITQGAWKAVAVGNRMVPPGFGVSALWGACQDDPVPRCGLAAALHLALMMSCSHMHPSPLSILHWLTRRTEVKTFDK